MAQKRALIVDDSRSARLFLARILEKHGIEVDSVESAEAAIGYLTSIVVSTGPLSVPVFLAYGLLKGAFIATEAAASLGVYIGKTLAFREFGALPVAVILKGLIAGSALMGGSFVAKHFMVRLTPSHFRLLMDGLLLAAGVSMLWAAL